MKARAGAKHHFGLELTSIYSFRAGQHGRVRALFARLSSLPIPKSFQERSSNFDDIRIFLIRGSQGEMFRLIQSDLQEHGACPRAVNSNRLSL